MNKGKLQALAVVVLLALFAVGAVLAALGKGNDLLKVVTPMMTLALGWTFARNVANGNSNGNGGTAEG